MSDEYFHIKTKDVRKIAEDVYVSLAEMLGWDHEFSLEAAMRVDIIDEVERIINDHEKKLGD